MKSLPIYLVEVLIENKPLARDPEGETIYKDLILRSGYDSVRSVRVGKMLRLEIESVNEEDAKNLAIKLCDDLRIYNPVVHTYRVEIRGKKDEYK